MMKSTIRLSDIPHVPTPAHDEFAPDLQRQARAALESRGLRWNNRTGRLHDNTGELERYVNQSDHVPHATEAAVMEWEFSRYINNSASRLQRGYTA